MESTVRGQGGKLQQRTRFAGGQISPEIEKEKVNFLPSLKKRRRTGDSTDFQKKKKIDLP